MATATITFFLSIFLILLASHVTSQPPPGSEPPPGGHPPGSEPPPSPGSEPPPGSKHSPGSKCAPKFPEHDTAVEKEDIDLLQFAKNLEFLEAEFFLHSALGEGLDKVAPDLAMGGPPPTGAEKAKLNDLVKNIITEFGYQEVGHLKAIQATVQGFPRPEIDLSKKNFAKIFDEAFGYHINPPFDVYASETNFMLGAYIIPYMGLVGYVGTNPFLKGYKSKRLLSGLLGVEGGQDAVIRMYLYERADNHVNPYNHTVSDIVNRLSHLRNKLAECGRKDEGLVVPEADGAEKKTTSNVISANGNSLSYARAPVEILRVVYGTGDEHTPGSFFPKGAGGKIATELLGKKPGVH